MNWRANSPRIQAVVQRVRPSMTEKPQSSVSSRRLRTWAERLLIAAALIFIAYRLGPQVGALVGIGPAHGPAPDFSFTALDGTVVNASELRGQVVVLNFWATWCGPCRLEMPSLQSLHEDRVNDGVVVLGLATDNSPPREIESFLDERGISYPVGVATPSQVRAFGGVPMIPTTLLIDRDGIIRHRIEGYAAPPVLRVAVNRLRD